MLRFIGISKGKLIKKMAPKDVADFIKNKGNMAWVDLEAPTLEDYMLLTNLGFHPLEIEDCQYFTYLPKINEFSDHIFITFHRFAYNREKDALEPIKIDVFLGRNYIITVHELPTDNIKAVMEKVRNMPEILERGPDFVLHKIMDNAVDQIFPILDGWSDQIEELNARVLKGDTEERTLRTAMRVKRDIVDLMRSIGPQMRIVKNFVQREYSFISPGATIYFSDLYDHLVMIYGNLKSYDDFLSEVLKSYQSVLLRKINRQTKALAFVSMTLLPLVLAFIVYGVDVLAAQYQTTLARYAVLAFLACAALLVGVYFKNKGWI